MEGASRAEPADCSVAGGGVDVTGGVAPVVAAPNGDAAAAAPNGDAVAAAPKSDAVVAAPKGAAVDAAPKLEEMSVVGGVPAIPARALHRQQRLSQCCSANVLAYT